MDLRLVRDSCGPTCTQGSLYVNGVFACYTLEDVDRKLEEAGKGKIYGETAIPRGKYKVVLDYSQRFKRIMPHVLGVPGFSGIRIHPGNTIADTDGCILVGVVRAGNSVLNSKTAYERLMILLEDATARDEDLTLEVE